MPVALSNEWRIVLPSGATRLFSIDGRRRKRRNRAALARPKPAVPSNPSAPGPFAPAVNPANRRAAENEPCRHRAASLTIALPMSTPTYARSAVHTVAENATLAFFLMDVRQHCTYMNAAAERLTGFSLGEILAREQPLHDIIHHRHPDGRPFPIDECPIDRALPQRAREQGEDVFVHKDGHFYAVAFTASPIVEGGVAVGTVIEVRDLGAERRQADALRESEARYRFLAETIPVQIWTALPDGRLDYVTEQTARRFGLTPERLLDEGWQNVVHPDDLPRAAERWAHALATGETYEVEFRLRLFDGTYAHHLARAVPQRGSGGAIVRWFGTNTNIEDQHEQQRRTVALLDEVAEQARQSEAALLALRRAKEASDARVAELEAALASS